MILGILSYVQAVGTSEIKSGFFCILCGLWLSDQCADSPSCVDLLDLTGTPGSNPQVACARGADRWHCVYGGAFPDL